MYFTLCDEIVGIVLVWRYDTKWMAARSFYKEVIDQHCDGIGWEKTRRHTRCTWVSYDTLARYQTKQQSSEGCCTRTAQHRKLLFQTHSPYCSRAVIIQSSFYWLGFGWTEYLTIYIFVSVWAAAPSIPKFFSWKSRVQSFNRVDFLRRVHKIRNSWCGWLVAFQVVVYLFIIHLSLTTFFFL